MEEFRINGIRRRHRSGDITRFRAGTLGRGPACGDQGGTTVTRGDVDRTTGDRDDHAGRSEASRHPF